MHPFVQAKKTLLQSLVLPYCPVNQIIINRKIRSASKLAPIPINPGFLAVDFPLKRFNFISEMVGAQASNLQICLSENMMAID
jgi:hypothetical protein